MKVVNFEIDERKKKEYGMTHVRGNSGKIANPIITLLYLIVDIDRVRNNDRIENFREGY